MLWFLAGSVLVLGGNWPLQRVVIFGRFDFITTLEQLPAFVQHLQLCMHPKATPQIVDLAKFCKVEVLKELVIVPHGPDPSYQPGNCFILSTTSADLTSLTLSSWPLLVQDGCNAAAAECLPSLLYASLRNFVGVLNDLTRLDDVKA